MASACNFPIFERNSNRSGGGFEELGPEEVTKKHGLQKSRQVIDLLALWGDTSDNVPGVKGIGEKTAATLLTQYHDIEGIYACLLYTSRCV